MRSSLGSSLPISYPFVVQKSKRLEKRIMFLTTLSIIGRQEAGGRRQEAVGRGQGAGGRRQGAGGSFYLFSHLPAPHSPNPNGYNVKLSIEERHIHHPVVI
jgi:hypothetical protein